MKSVFWRVAKRLSYIHDARCLNVKYVKLKIKGNIFSDHTGEILSHKQLSKPDRRLFYVRFVSFQFKRNRSFQTTHRHCPPNSSISMNLKHCQPDAYVNVLMY